MIERALNLSERLHIRWVAAGLLVLGFVSVALRAIESPWSISATAVRKFEDPQFDRWGNARNPPPPKAPEHSPPYSIPDVEVGERDIWIQRRLIEPPRSHGGEVGALMIEAKGAIATLPGELEIELAATGLWIPGDEEVLRYFDPKTGKTVPGFPELPPIAPQFLNDPVQQPVLRLVFAGSGLRTWDGEVEAFDRRTHWPVISGSVKRSGPVRFADIQLKIWHDTPIQIMLELPCGTPDVAAIPTKAGDQIVLESGVRFQFIASGPNDVREVGRRGETWDLVPDNDLRFVLGRVSPAVWAEQCHFRYQGIDESLRFPRAWFERKPRIQAARLPMADAPIEIVCYPQRARVWFDIEALPFMPNPRSTRNLFEVNIPVVNSMDVFDLFDLAADAVELDSNLLIPFSEDIENIERRNTTPTKVLKVLRNRYEGHRLGIESEHNALVLKQEGPTLWDGFREWITNIRPF